VIESISPNDTAQEVEEKVEEWLATGVRLVWVLYTDSRHIHVHRQDGSVSKLHGENEVSGESVLPGFNCRTAQVFEGI
jgi:Uma2 family endonuclease